MARGSCPGIRNPRRKVNQLLMMKSIHVLLCIAAAVHAVDPFPNCNGGENSGCHGSATARALKARDAVKEIEINGKAWSSVRQDLVTSCGLKYQR